MKEYRKYEPEFKMMIAKRVVHEGITTIDAGKLYGIRQQRIHDWAKSYIENGNTDFITGNKSKKEILRDKLFWKAATLAYRSNQYKNKAEALARDIEAEKINKSSN